MKQIRSDKLSEAIKNVMESVAELLTISAEYTPSPDEEEVNFPFELSSQFERPSEFIQCLLDMIRANFEPHIINRLGLVTGRWQFGKVEQGLVSLWLWNHFTKNKLYIKGYKGSGKQIRDVLFILLESDLDWPENTKFLIPPSEKMKHNFI